jgi:hypothetical protein
VTGWAAGERREGQVCREVYLSKVLLQGGGGAGEGRDRGAGGGRDGPWATQGMSMRYGEIVCVCVCVCHTHTLSLSLSLSLPLSLSLSLSRFLLQLLRTLSQCTDSHTLAHTHTQHHSNTRATCRHAALLEEALLRRAGDTPREHSPPSLPSPHIHKSKRLPRAHAQIQAHTYAYAYGGQGTREGSITPPHTHTHRCHEVWFEIRAQG